MGDGALRRVEGRRDVLESDHQRRLAAAGDGASVYVQSCREDQREDLTAALLSELSDGDLVLLKGSRGLEMERIVQALTETNEDSNLRA